MQSPERPSKQDAFLALLREGWTSLHLDARRPGVTVPAHLRSEAHLVLQYGHDLPIPIPDLEIDERGVRATLSFSKSPQRTVVPWSAVYVVACDDGRGVLYHEDVPEDVSIIASRPPTDGVALDDGVDALDSIDGHPMGGGAPGSDGPSGRISERLLRSIPAEATDADLPQPLGVRRRRKPQLRLVK
jgi:stringent starvation protein B